MLVKPQIRYYKYFKSPVHESTTSIKCFYELLKDRIETISIQKSFRMKNNRLLLTAVTHTPSTIAVRYKRERDDKTIGGQDLERGSCGCSSSSMSKKRARRQAGCPHVARGPRRHFGGSTRHLHVSNGQDCESSYASDETSSTIMRGDNTR